MKNRRPNLVRETSANMLKAERDFAEKIAHDICTPLHVIGQFLSCISEEIADEDAKRLYAAACLSIGKVNNLVDLLKGHATSSFATKKSCDVVELIQHVVTELNSLAKDKSVSLTFTAPAHMVCSVNALAMERIVANLVKNAIEAMDKIEGYVNVQLFQRNDAIFLNIRDNGCGVRTENLGKLFDKGFTYGKKHGTGIGLAYCKQAVEAHGGNISVYSQEGAGTLFSIVIPAAIIATCNVEEAADKEFSRPITLLQICTAEDMKQDIKTWVMSWESMHNAEKITRVRTHCFMLDEQEDSIGMF